MGLLKMSKKHSPMPVIKLLLLSWEPIQGEAGIVVPPEDYLPKSRVVRKKHNVLLICGDESKLVLPEQVKCCAMNIRKVSSEYCWVRAILEVLCSVCRFLLRKSC